MSLFQQWPPKLTERLPDPITGVGYAGGEGLGCRRWCRGAAEFIDQCGGHPADSCLGADFGYRVWRVAPRYSVLSLDGVDMPQDATKLV
jgi:hypothetical protein